MASVKNLSIATAGAAFITLGTFSVAQAATLGGRLFATGGNIQVQTLSSEAKWNSELRLYSPRSQYIGTNRDVGSVINLGRFSAGQELIFGIYVPKTGNTFVMGPGSRNADRLPHAVVNFLAPGVAVVGFEHAWGAIDDYNDHNFLVRGAISATQPSVPPTLTGVLLNGKNADLTIFEGQSVSATLKATDPNPQAITFLVDGKPVGKDSRTSGTRQISANLGLFPDEGNFSYTVQAQDTSGLYSNTITRTLNVLNVDPIITSLTQDLMDIRTSTLFDFAATATDAGINDILTYDWDFNGDGLFDDFTGLGGQWSFLNPGLHTVGLRVSDGDGGFAYGSFKVNAISEAISIPEPKPVPEPSSTLGLLAFGAFSAGTLLKRKQQQKALDSVATD